LNDKEKVKKENIKEFIDYIDNAINSRPHGESYWVDEDGDEEDAMDVGYGIDWWRQNIKPEIERIYRIEEE